MYIYMNEMDGSCQQLTKRVFNTHTCADDNFYFWKGPNEILFPTLVLYGFIDIHMSICLKIKKKKKSF